MTWCLTWMGVNDSKCWGSKGAGAGGAGAMGWMTMMTMSQAVMMDSVVLLGKWQKGDDAERRPQSEEVTA